MELKVLTENKAGANFLAEHGLSYIVTINGEPILFDTGHSNTFLKNASKLGINIHNEVNTVVLSHGHWDHGNGLQHIHNKTIITHPESFVRRYRKNDHSPIGLSFSKEEMCKSHELIERTNPFQVTDNLLFLGEIPRLTAFENQTTPFELENGNDDFVRDDSALVATENNELVVITGCSHSGICNICEHAKKVTRIEKIKAVIGGFHLKHKNKQTLETIKYFKENKVKNILPSHCTDLPALSAFYEEFNIHEVKTGMIFQF